jgi:cytochrome c-type biogenesis protein CcmH
MSPSRAASSSPDASTPAARMANHGLRVWAPWVAMAVVLVIALTIGIVGSSGPETNADRMMAIARTLKCEVCAGESVAESDSDFAQQARIEIARRLDEGQSPAQIRAYFVDTNGENVSLLPSSTGVSSLVWVIPVIALVVAGAFLVMVFRRWQVRADVPLTESDRELVARALGDPGASPGPTPAADDDPEQGGGR